MDFRKAKELLKTGLIFTFVLSCILTIFLQHNAHMTAISFLHDSRCEELLILLSYTFPFASIHSCICGYSLGLKQTKIPAVSQLFEQTFRILFVFLFCYFRTSHQLDLSISFAVVGLAIGETHQQHGRKIDDDGDDDTDLTHTRSPFGAFSSMIKAWHDFTTVKHQSARPLGRFLPYDRNFVLCSVQYRSICQQAVLWRRTACWLG